MKTSLAFVVLGALLLAGCGTVSRRVTAADSPQTTDWGTVELSANVPTHLRIGQGQECTLTATWIGGGNLLVEIKSQEKLAKGQTPAGMPAGTSIETTQTMTVPSGVEVVAYVGQKLVRFTPKFKG
jgi:hypothetical protein